LPVKPAVVNGPRPHQPAERYASFGAVRSREEYCA
jgi:hypothetical protein